MFDNSERRAETLLRPPISASSLALGSLSSVALSSNWPARSVSKSRMFMPKIDMKTNKFPLDPGSPLIDDSGKSRLDYFMHDANVMEEHKK